MKILQDTLTFKSSSTFEYFLSSSSFACKKMPTIRHGLLVHFPVTWFKLKTIQYYNLLVRPFLV